MAQYFPVFDWNNKQNGYLIGSIGIISTLLQGGYVRRASGKVGEVKLARRGILSCAIGLCLLSLVPLYTNSQVQIARRLLYGASVCMAITSATVVNCLTAYASMQCDEGGFDPNSGKQVKEHPELAKGKALGHFRSAGQIGRAMGPLLGAFGYVETHSAHLMSDSNSLCILLDIWALAHLRSRSRSDADGVLCVKAS
jgi:MFS family permease